MTTLKDIATVAGVSISTVSKALNGKSSDISVSMRTKILEIAIENGYVPKNRKSGTRQRTNNIGIICPEIRSAYYSMIITRLEAAFRKKGYVTTIGFSDFKYSTEVELLSSIADAEPAGIVCITEGIAIQQNLEMLKRETGVPIMLIATKAEKKAIDSIKIDDAAGVFEAVDYLVGTGHRHIGYIGDIESKDRRKAFEGCIEKSGEKLTGIVNEKKGSRFEERGYDGMREFLKMENRPTGVLAAYDDVAIGAIKAVKDAGLKVPEDISVIGIDGIVVGEYLETPLTTIESNIGEMAKIASKILIRKIEDPTYKTVQSVEIKPNLKIRDTVRVLKRDEKE